MFRRSVFDRKRGPTPPKQLKAVYVPRGFDVNGGANHSRYTCEGDEIDEIYCEGRSGPYTIIARRPDSRKRYMGFDYDVVSGVCGFMDFDISEKEMKRITERMELMKENTW